MDFVIGLNLCPWGAIAEQQGRVRVVTSTAQNEEEALEDLRTEAAKLPGPGEETSKLELGRAQTTLVVFPHVASWDDFTLFNQFFRERLDLGEGLLEDFDQKVVAFHPKTSTASEYLKKGDEVTITGKGGIFLLCKVLNPHVDTAEDGTRIASVRVLGEIVNDNDTFGEDNFIGYMPIKGTLKSKLKRVRTDRIVWQAGGPSDVSLYRSLIARAPRPVLHLLRWKDVEPVDNDARDAVLETNKSTIKEVGVDELNRMLEECH